MSLPNNFNHQIYRSDLPVLFMVRDFYRSNLSVLSLGLAKWDLWGLGAESRFVAASYAFGKMIPPLQWRIILEKA
jgi:hypothetical protein